MMVIHTPSRLLAVSVLTVLQASAADQLAIWSFPSLSSLASGSSVNATTEVLTGTPTVTIRNSDVASSGTTGTAYTDIAGVSQAANKALGWSDFKKSGQSVDGQLDIAFNATGRSSMTLRFDYKHSNDNNSVEKELQWSYSTNGGSSWATATKFTVTDNNTWKSKSITLPAAVDGQANVVIRIEKWASDTNSTEVNKALYFDNIELAGNASTGGGGGGQASPVLTIASSSSSIPTDNPVSLCGAVGDTADAARTAITLSPADADTADASLTATVTSSKPSVATATLTKQTSGGQDTYALTLNPVSTGYATITVTVSDPESHSATYVVNYAVSAASSTPATSRYHAGASDASTAIALDSDWMLVGNDEDQIIRLYDRNHSGQPAKTFDLNANLGLAKEADFEASVRFGNRIYWIGSHGNDKDGNTEPTRNMVCAYDVTGTGTGTTLTYVNKFTNLKSQLISWDNANGHGLGAKALGLEASAASGMLPTDPDGFNIEGATNSGSQVLLGFRAPLMNKSARNKALVIPVTNFQTIASAGSGTMQFGSPVFLDLGGRAIRSMATLPSGNILILAGPVGDPSASLVPAFALYRWDGNSASAPVRVSSSLDDVASNGGGSPEAIIDPPAELSNGSQVQVIQDNGTTEFYGDGIVGKDLTTRAYAKSRSDVLTIGLNRVVTTATDENNVVPGTGVSLREAVAAALWPDTIGFSSTLNGATLTLTNGELAVDSGLSIDASTLSSGITVSGNNASRVFNIGAGDAVSLTGLVLTKGSTSAAGGLIANNGGNVSLLNCTLSNSHAGTDGGAIANNSGSLALANTTVSGNNAGNRGGGLYSASGTITFDHATVTANAAPTGSGLATSGGSANAGNSILAGNNGSANVSGTLSGGNNLTTGDPKLGPLANYGGATPVAPPLPGSPAIDAAGTSALANDQRGVARTLGSLPDIGACESFALGTLSMIDTDHDGIDDRLEPALGLLVGTNDSSHDSDGDGQSDAFEIANMTDPKNPASRLAVEGFHQVATDAGTGKPVYTFTFATFPGLTYEIEASSTLASFQTVPGSRFTADGYSKTLQLPLDTGRAFIRVVRK
ncbi:MAG: DUF3616 domain-containing protein [Luteolibacter sp.]